MPLKDRVYVCPDCGHTEDRDLNAAKNIEGWFEGIYIPMRSDQTARRASKSLWSRQTSQESF
ncbi:MAG: zinc ribbon domain-containing protein [Microcoleus sp.]